MSFLLQSPFSLVTGKNRTDPSSINPMRKITLFCWILDSSKYSFPVDIDDDRTVGHLKEEILKKKPTAFPDVDADELTLWKVSIEIDKQLKDSVGKYHFSDETELLESEQLVDIFPPPEPTKKTLNIVVQVPRLRHHISKRPRLGSEPPSTPPAKIRVEMVKAKDSPEPLTRADTEAKLNSSIKDFEMYIQCLATGKLDGYLDSLRPEDKHVIGHLPLDPILLLHDLGRYPNQERIDELFNGDTVHVFGVSGAGKTRVALDGLCQNWGLYISCKPTRGPASGSDDFREATKMLQGMSDWNKGESSEDIHKNVQAADRTFTMLLCARFFVLKQLVQRLPVGTDDMTARRRWVLAQVLPARSGFSDLFTVVLQSLRYAGTDIMRQIIHSMVSFSADARPDLFPEGNLTTFSVVVDEAQVAADHLKEYFRSTAGTDMRPILHEMYRFLLEFPEVVGGIILSGTGLSMKMVEGAVSSVSAKRTEVKQTLIVTDVGRFDDASQEIYIRRYLTLDDMDSSDRLLLERIKYWFSGRHRLTASIIELLLSSEDVPRHRVLTAFVERLTGFKLLDATELEDGEPPISKQLLKRIKSYQPITSLDRLFTDGKNVELIQCLVDVLMRWTLGSQLTAVAIEGNMHEIIALGVGFLDKKTNAQKFDPDLDHSVYISEPLVVLSLRSLFEQNSWTTRKSWINNAVRNARNNASLGFVFEEVALFVIMELFGGKFCALGDAFHCDRSLGQRKVTLVSLKTGADGVRRSYPVSWSTGVSDRFGLKARSPADVLAFLNDPDGKAFVFPDIHMGPDLCFFLQDEMTKEIIASSKQLKSTPTLDAVTWRGAVISVTPRFFYTVVENEGRAQYAPKSYPNLVNDLSETLEMLLGPAVYNPIANDYRAKLRSYTESQQQSALYPTRQTPRFLSIIGTPNDKQNKRLAGEHVVNSTEVVVLQWDNVRNYLGSMADLIKTGVGC